jgi:hypothetical protein
MGYDPFFFFSLSVWIKGFAFNTTQAMESIIAGLLTAGFRSWRNGFLIEGKRFMTFALLSLFYGHFNQ